VEGGRRGKWKETGVETCMFVKDLIDNAVDAALDPNFIGRINIYPDIYQSTTTGICLQNNCAKRVAPLERVLVVYESSKVGKKSQWCGMWQVTALHYYPG
jgi:hypothetical protein